VLRRLRAAAPGAGASSRLALAALLVLAALLPAAAARAAAHLPVPAPDATFESAGQERSLAEFRGTRVMLWMLSTWCSSCAAGLAAMAEKRAVLERAGLQVLAIRNLDNGGYPGPALREFVARFGPGLLEAGNWTFGEAGAEMARRYNPRRYPDIYFLIDEQGMLRAVEGTPGVTMDTITRFAGVGR